MDRGAWGFWGRGAELGSLSVKPWGRVGAPTLSPENDGASKCVQGVDDWALSPFLLTSDSLLPEAFCLECPPRPALPGFALGSFQSSLYHLASACHILLLS